VTGKQFLKKTIIDSIHDSSTNLSEVSNSFFSWGEFWCRDFCFEIKLEAPNFIRIKESTLGFTSCGPSSSKASS
jgi:hypothetical protein